MTAMSIDSNVIDTLMLIMLVAVLVVSMQD